MHEEYISHMLLLFADETNKRCMPVFKFSSEWICL